MKRRLALASLASMERRIERITKFAILAITAMVALDLIAAKPANAQPGKTTTTEVIGIAQEFAGPNTATGGFFVVDIGAGVLTIEFGAVSTSVEITSGDTFHGYMTLYAFGGDWGNFFEPIVIRFRGRLVSTPENTVIGCGAWTVVSSGGLLLTGHGELTGSVDLTGLTLTGILHADFP